MKMKTSALNQNINSHYVGLDLYKARKKILHDFPDIEEDHIDIFYEESEHPRFTVLSCAFDHVQKRFKLKVSSPNPIRHLPSNYQNNDFLRGFLMIFQHIMNDTSLTLDTMHEYFRPMESPLKFLPVLADWLGIHLDTLGGEDEVRQFLQYAIPLYRYRGTAIGLKAHLAIITKMVPEIIEDANPFQAMIIHDKAELDASLFEADKGENCFTIYFDKERTYFDDVLIRRMSRVIQQEKPVYTKAYIAFKKPAKQKRKVTVIEKDHSMNADGVIFI
jgi:phage tail-like protein